ncbi:MAG: response regulator [Pseudomonadales bacterium]|nr:response regulator [Pseudomonadales bacterium]
MDRNRKVKILVVEDDEQYQRFLGELLTEMGYTPFLARTGWEGLKDCQLEEPQLVLTDIFMPHLDGVKFIELIRKSDYFIPIIAMTGGIGGKEKEHHLQSAWLRGADATISKPIDPDVLRSKIESLLKTYAEMREARGHSNAETGPDTND